MAGYWSIIVPEAVTNICTNPSFESAVTGWAAGAGHTFAQSSAQAFKGAYSGLVTVGGAGTPLATYAVSGLTASGTYYLSAWVYVPAGWDGGNIRLEIASLTSAVATYNHIWTSGTDPTAVWKYIETKVVLDSDVTGTFQLARTGTATTAVTMYLDAVQFEAKTDHTTTYCDGDQPGCLWTGSRHLSTSERSAQVRSGGRVYNLDDLYAYVTRLSGAGMPPVKHLTQGQALMPGAMYQGAKVLPRQMALIFDAVGTSRENLHSVRKDIIDYIKSDAVKGAQPFRLRYTGAYSYRPVEIDCVYSGGLEMGALDGYTETIAMALTCYDPFFYELGDQATHMGASQSLASTNYILTKADGVWAQLGTGMNDVIRCLAIAPNGNLYAGGAFTDAGGKTVNYIAYWNGSAWTELSVGGNNGLNGVVQDIVFAPNGDLYACGNFTTSTGGDANKYLRIVKWDGSAWTALPVHATNGLSGQGNAMTWGLDGKLYVTGNFSTAAGVTVNNVAVWDGAAWAAMGGTPGVNDIGNSICTLPNGNIVVGGQFTTAGGGAALRIAKWNGTAWSAMGTGFQNGQIDALLCLADGQIYAGGTFTTYAGYNHGSYLAIWNGTYWRGLPSEVNGNVNYIGQMPDGNILAGGEFTSAGALATGDRIAIWNGSTWSLVDADLPGSPAEFDAVWNGAGDLFMEFGTAGTATTSAAYTATNNGTTNAYPKITIKRSGGTTAYIKWIKNETTGASLNFGEYALLDGEILEIDTTPGSRSIKSSIYRGLSSGLAQGTIRPYSSAWNALLPNSDLANFYFLPGSNTITVYILTSGSPTVTVYAVCRKPHWGVDGAAI